MYKQTSRLCELLPNFASLYKAADARSSATWRVVRWKDISPSEVCPNQVQILDGEHENRTASLYACRYAAEEAGGYSEKEHPYLWKSVQGDTTLYQCVMPVFQGETITASATKPVAKDGPVNTMVRLSEEAHRTLRRMADENGKTLQATLEAAIKEYDRYLFFKGAEEDYRLLKADPQAWAEELEERKLWENTLMDGIDRNEIWNEDGTVTLLPEQERQVA